MILKVEELLGKCFDEGKYSLSSNISKDKSVPISPGLHLEIDDSELLNEQDYSLYQKLLGSLQWLYTIGCRDVQYSVCSLSRFSVHQGTNN